MGLDREDLVQVDPAPCERVGATCQVQPPDPQGLFRHFFGGGLKVVLQPLAPVIQRTCVVQAQAFDIDDFQPDLTDLGTHHRQVR
ncbi:hypothetical protein D3C78_509630 [compost metagenome]